MKIQINIFKGWRIFKGWMKIQIIFFKWWRYKLSSSKDEGTNYNLQRIKIQIIIFKGWSCKLSSSKDEDTNYHLQRMKIQIIILKGWRYNLSSSKDEDTNYNLPRMKLFIIRMKIQIIIKGWRYKNVAWDLSYKVEDAVFLFYTCIKSRVALWKIWNSNEIWKRPLRFVTRADINAMQPATLRFL